MKTPSSAPEIRKIGDDNFAMTIASWTIVAMGVVTALYVGQDLLIPIALALLLSFVLSPLVSLAKKARIPRAPAVVGAVLLAFAVILGLGAVIAGQIGQLAGDLPQYQSTMREKVQSAREAVGGSRTLDRAVDMLQNLGREFSAPATDGETTRPGESPEAAPQGPMPVEVRQPPKTALENLQMIAEPLLHPMATLGIIIVFVIFILLQREDLRNRFMRLAGTRDIQRTTAAIDDAAKRLSRLLLTQLVLNASFGLAIGVGLWLIGVPGAGLFGIMAGVLRFVPYIGAAIAAVAPLMLSAAVDPGWGTFIATAALFAVVEPLVGHVIEPMVYGRSTGLSPVAVVVAATFWTALWGPIGLVLATPLTVCLVVLGRHVESLAFFDTLLGDRPVLTPPELFYQRMLARDPGESAEKAIEFLRERRLSAYYEEVALPGLMLAQRDADRGALEGERLDAIRSSVAELVEELAPYRDVEPTDGRATTDPEAAAAIEQADKAAGDAAPGGEAVPQAGRAPPVPVRCVAGRTPIEEAAGMIVVQLLEKHGLDAQLESGEFLLTTGVVEIEPAAPPIVCAIFLDADEAQIRLVIRRLRKRLPQAHVLVAAWSSLDRGFAREDIARSARADDAGSSLRDVVARCLEEARRRSKPPAASAIAAPVASAAG